MYSYMFSAMCPLGIKHANHYIVFVISVGEKFMWVGNHIKFIVGAIAIL